MERLIIKLDKNTSIVYDKGKFDDWCVYVKQSGGKYAQTDVDYFYYFKDLAIDYTTDRVYREFVSIYEQVGDLIEKKVLDFIIIIAKQYPSPIDRDVALYFIVIYAGMVAERNKKHAILKEKVKRLGMHQILVEGMKVEEAANYSRGKKASFLREICLSKGF